MVHPKTGTLCQSNFDLGDSPNRTGNYLLYLWITGNLYRYKELSQNAVGTFSTPDGWTRGGVGDKQDYVYNPADFSRDQASALFMGLFCGDMLLGKTACLDYYRQCFRRSCTHQNSDLLSEWNLIIRYFYLSGPSWRKPFFWLILLIIDFKFVVETSIPQLHKKWDGANLIIPPLLFCLLKVPTPAIKLAAWLATRKPDLEREMLANHGDQQMADFGYEVSTNGCSELIIATKVFFNTLRGK